MCVCACVFVYAHGWVDVSVGECVVVGVGVWCVGKCVGVRVGMHVWVFGCICVCEVAMGGIPVLRYYCDIFTKR